MATAATAKIPAADQQGYVGSRDELRVLVEPAEVTGGQILNRIDPEVMVSAVTKSTGPSTKISNTCCYRIGIGDACAGRRSRPRGHRQLSTGLIDATLRRD